MIQELNTTLIIQKITGNNLVISYSEYSESTIKSFRLSGEGGRGATRIEKQ